MIDSILSRVPPVCVTRTESLLGPVLPHEGRLPCRSVNPGRHGQRVSGGCDTLLREGRDYLPLLLRRASTDVS